MSFPTTGLRAAHASEEHYVHCLFRMLGTPIHIFGEPILIRRWRFRGYGVGWGSFSYGFALVAFVSAFYAIAREVQEGKPNPQSISDKHIPTYYGTCRSQQLFLHTVRQKSKTYTQPHAVLAYQSLQAQSTRTSLGSTHGIGKEQKPRSRRKK